MRTYRFPLLLCVFCFLLTASVPLLAQPQLLPTRQIIPLTDWKFDARLLPKPGTEQAGFDDAKWQSVTVPHTWNSKTQIQTHRAAWYRTHFRLASDAQTREIFVCFDGVGTVADVYLNGVSLGSHRGAYTRFVFDARRGQCSGCAL
jgi:beta-galactosidase